MSYYIRTCGKDGTPDIKPYYLTFYEGIAHKAEWSEPYWLRDGTLLPQSFTKAEAIRVQKEMLERHIPTELRSSTEVL